MLTSSGTWEPEENLAGTDLLIEWDRKKARMGDNAFQRFMAQNEARFDKACRTAEAEKKARQIKRDKKRARMKKRRRHVITPDDSEDDIPLLQQKRRSQQTTMSPRTGAPASQEDELRSLFFDSQEQPSAGKDPAPNQTEAGLFVRQSPVARRAPLDQSSSEDTSGEETDDSMLGEIAANARKLKRKTSATNSRRNKGPTLGNSILSSASPQKGAEMASTSKAPQQDSSAKPPNARSAPPAREQAEKKTTQKGTEAQRNPRRPNQPAIQTPTAAQHRAANGTGSASSVLPQRQREGVQPPKAGNGTNASTVSSASGLQKSSGPNSMTAIRKSGAAAKNSGTIKMVNEAPTRVRKEWQHGDKPFSRMKYVGLAEKRSRNEGAPDPTALEFVGHASIGLTIPRPAHPADNPYGRREGGNRRVQEEDDTEERRRRDPVEDDTPLQAWEKRKAPLVCPHWRLSNNCPYDRERCNFIHRHKDENGRDYPVGDPTGWLPPKYRIKPLTCLFWMKYPAGCKKPEAECNYAHRNTGWIPKSETNGEDVIEIDTNLPPASEIRVRCSTFYQAIPPACIHAWLAHVFFTDQVIAIMLFLLQSTRHC